jgi:hypothetical protein
MQEFSQTFQRVFISGQGVAVYKDIEPRIFSLDHDI